MNSKEIKYLDADYMKQIESMKTEIKHVYFLFFLIVLCFGMLFLFFHFQNKRLVKVEMKVEIHGAPMDKKPLMCSIFNLNTSAQKFRDLDQQSKCGLQANNHLEQSSSEILKL